DWPPRMERPTLIPRAFWFLRHGETDWNARNLSQGNVDIPLNEVGIAQAKSAAALLKDRGIRSIVASTLSRAHDTARTVGSVIGRPVALDDELRENSFGVQEGQPMSDWFAAWVDGTATPEGAEPFMDLRARAVRAINRAQQHESPLLIVAHGALFRATRAEMNLEPNIRTPNAVPFFCEPGTTPQKPWTLTPAS
ncbi:MAG: histidine phosphatase family protein, partial [Janthinobacterium lividum]